MKGYLAKAAERGVEIVLPTDIVAADGFAADAPHDVVAADAIPAERMGLDYRSGQPVRLGTANGITQGWRLKLDTVRIGDMQVFGIEAVVTPQPMPYVLLGNSFLAEFQMTRNNNQMVLEKRH